MRFDRWTLRVTFHYPDAEKGDKLSQEERLFRDITLFVVFSFSILQQSWLFITVYY